MISITITPHTLTSVGHAIIEGGDQNIICAVVSLVCQQLEFAHTQWSIPNSYTLVRESGKFELSCHTSNKKLKIAKELIVGSLKVLHKQFPDQINLHEVK